MKSFEKIKSLIEILSIVVGAVWIFYLYVSFDNKDNQLELKLKEKEIELQTLNQTNLTLENKRLELQNLSMEAQQRLDSFKVTQLKFTENLNKLSLEKIKAEVSSETKKGELSDIEIKSIKSKTVDWVEFAASMRKIKTLSYLPVKEEQIIEYFEDFYNSDDTTIEEVREEIIKDIQKPDLVANSVTIKVSIKNTGKVPINIDNIGIEIYTGLLLDNDLAKGSVFKINAPKELGSKNAIKWQEVHKETIDNTDFGLAGFLLPEQSKDISLQYIINTNTKEMIGVRTNISTPDALSYGRSAYTIVSQNVVTPILARQIASVDDEEDDTGIN